KRRIPVQHLVIETQMVEPNDQIRSLQVLDQLIDLRFAVDLVLVARRAVGHPYAHAHPANLAPAAHFISRFLRLQIEIENVLHRQTVVSQLALPTPHALAKSELAEDEGQA